MVGRARSMQLRNYVWSRKWAVGKYASIVFYIPSQTVFFFFFQVSSSGGRNSQAPDQPLRNFVASKSVVRHSWASWSSLISWFWRSKIVKGSAGQPNIVNKVLWSPFSAAVTSSLMTDRTFRRLRAWKSAHRRILCGPETSIDGFPGFETVKCPVRYFSAAFKSGKKKFAAAAAFAAAFAAAYSQITSHTKRKKNLVGESSRVSRKKDDFQRDFVKGHFPPKKQDWPFQEKKVSWIFPSKMW